jgi:hypothetical protein
VTIVPLGDALQRFLRTVAEGPERHHPTPQDRVPSQVSKADAAQLRALRAEQCLWSMLAAAERQTDPATALRVGLPDAKDFLEAIYTGDGHPLINLYKERKKKHGRRGAAPTELAMRRQIVSAVVALTRTGLTKDEARKKVAQELQEPHGKGPRRHPGLPSPSKDVLRNWDDATPPLSADEDKIMAEKIAATGGDHRKLIDYYLGLAHAVGNPAKLVW